MVLQFFGAKSKIKGKGKRAWVNSVRFKEYEIRPWKLGVQHF